jgi:hypothetical protein
MLCLQDASCLSAIIPSMQKTGSAELVLATGISKHVRLSQML